MAIYDQKPMVGRTDNAKKLKQSESVRRKKTWASPGVDCPPWASPGVDMGVARGWTCPPWA